MTHRTSKPSVLCAEIPAVSHAGTYDAVTRSSLVEEDGQKKAAVDQARALQPNGAATGNNYYRSEGQNVGNFMTDRPSSRVLAPPGGGSQISFGADSGPGPHGKVNICCCPQCQSLNKHAGTPLQQARLRLPCMLLLVQGEYGQADKSTSLFMGGGGGGGSPNGGNNYSRPSGQNVGNFLTDRNSSRVLAPPGGASQISFG